MLQIKRMNLMMKMMKVIVMMRSRKKQWVNEDHFISALGVLSARSFSSCGKE
jgi:hypothetical protein